MHDFSRYIDTWWGLRRVFETDGFKTDAKRLGEIPPDQFEAAIDALGAATGILEEKEVLGLLSAVVDGEQREALLHFVTSISAWKASRLFDGEFVERFQRELSLALENAVDASALPRILERGGHIGRATFSGIDLAAKALHLVTAVGSKLSRCTLVCDLRPVFDAERTQIEALIPITTLKVVTIGEDAVHPESFELHLTEKEVDEFIAKFEAAKSKLRSLKNFVSSSGVRLPVSPMIETEAEQ